MTAGLAINAFCEHSRKREKPRDTNSQPLTAIDVAIRDAKRRASTGEWDGSKGSTFIGLYAMCHEMVYGVVPDELFQQAIFRAAAKNAANALHDLFDDDPTKLVMFVRWAWAREKRKHDWATAQGFDRNRLSWKWQFSRNMLTDYRISLTQKRR